MLNCYAKLRGYDGIGRHARFRFSCESVQVRPLLPAPNKNNPNLLPIGETFGFSLYFDYPNFNTKNIKSEVKENDKHKRNASLGKWGRLHYDYLYRNKRTVINAMRLKGTLRAYLEQFDADTQDRFEKLVKRTAEVENVTEELKASDQMEWVRKMNGIRNRAEEVILNEIIYR